MAATRKPKGYTKKQLREMLAEAEDAVAEGREANLTDEEKEALASMTIKLTKELRRGV